LEKTITVRRKIGPFGVEKIFQNKNESLGRSVPRDFICPIFTRRRKPGMGFVAQ
jgi:hypothetical protein